MGDSVSVDDAAVHTWATATDRWHVSGTVVRALASSLLDARKERDAAISIVGEMREALTIARDTVKAARTYRGWERGTPSSGTSLLNGIALDDALRRYSRVDMDRLLAVPTPAPEESE